MVAATTFPISLDSTDVVTASMQLHLFRGLAHVEELYDHDRRPSSQDICPCYLPIRNPPYSREVFVLQYPDDEFLQLGCAASRFAQVVKHIYTGQVLSTPTTDIGKVTRSGGMANRVAVTDHARIMGFNMNYIQ
jgi:hypothetical protein